MSKVIKHLFKDVIALDARGEQSFDILNDEDGGLVCGEDAQILPVKINPLIRVGDPAVS
jgi:hypothetical protein